MKRHGYLFERMVSFPNLLAAAKRAFRGKKPDAESERLFLRLETELFDLQRELEEGVYAPGPCHVFWVNDPKRRRICAANLRDRIVHQAVCGAFEPVFESWQVFDSYACRKGKGQHAALRRAQSFSGSRVYFARADVRKFFDSVPHEVLLDKLRGKFKDTRLLGLCETIIRHEESAPGSARGLPIGNLTSQHWANFYLSFLDHFVKEELRVRKYLRYMDDMALFSDSKDELFGWLFEMSEYLGTELQLELKESACFVAPTWQGMPFLGCLVFPRLIRMRQKNKIRFFRKWRQREQQWHDGELDDQGFLQSASSLLGHIHHLNTRSMCRNFFWGRGPEAAGTG